MCFLSGHVLKVSESASVFSAKSLLINISTKFKQPYAALATEANFKLLNVKLLQRVFENTLCKNLRASLASLLGCQKLYSSKALTLLLEKEANAVYSAGILRKMKCSTVGVKFKPSQKYYGRISDCPLSGLFSPGDSSDLR